MCDFHGHHYKYVQEKTMSTRQPLSTPRDCWETVCTVCTAPCPNLWPKCKGAQKDNLHSWRFHAILSWQDDCDVCHIDDKCYDRLTHQSSTPPQMYGLSKVHKAQVPMRPIVAAAELPTYKQIIELAYILTPPTGGTTHRILWTRSMPSQSATQIWWLPFG